MSSLGNGATEVACIFPPRRPLVEIAHDALLIPHPRSTVPPGEALSQTNNPAQDLPLCVFDPAKANRPLSQNWLPKSPRVPSVQPSPRSGQACTQMGGVISPRMRGEVFQTDFEYSRHVASMLRDLSGALGSSHPMVKPPTTNEVRLCSQGSLSASPVCRSEHFSIQAWFPIEVKGCKRF